MAYFFFRGKIDFENLLVLEKTDLKPSTTTYINILSFTYFLLNLGYAIIRGRRIFLKSSQRGRGWLVVKNGSRRKKTKILLIDPRHN